jgi:predicted aldo/keto reductase-like oxidoreductase
MMESLRLGKSGLQVSRICLGMMTYGDRAWREWMLDEDEARPFVVRAFEHGINFFDTSRHVFTGQKRRDHRQVAGRGCRRVMSTFWQRRSFFR